MPDQLGEGGIGEVKAKTDDAGLFPLHVRRRIPLVHSGADQLPETVGQTVDGAGDEHGRHQKVPVIGKGTALPAIKRGLPGHGPSITRRRSPLT
jgi:hypothetical protein